MSEEATFLRAIIDHPEDDVVRLVYADWLDEHGNPDRAEFIRGQCRLAQMQEWDDGYAELNARCELLLRTHRDKWMMGVEIREGAPAWMLRQYGFRRGFLDRLTMQPDHFFSRWEQLFERTPVRRVEISPYPIDYFPQFWECEGLGHLQRLWLHRSHYSPPQPTATLSSAHWKVTDLGIPSDIAPNVTEAVVNSPYAPNLERLEINARDPTPTVWAALREADTLRNLKQFGFRSRSPLAAFIDPEDITNPSWFSQLERLELVGTPVREQFVLPGVRPLLDAGPLRALVLEGCGFAASEPSSLRVMPPVPLEHLDLSSARGIRRRVLRALIQSPGFANLQSFAFSGNGNASLTYLRDAPMRESLCVLRLSGCGASGLLALAKVGCPQLATLDIGLTQQGHDDSLAHALDAILDPNRFPKLVRLRIHHFGSSRSDIVRQLIENTAVGRLRELSLLVGIAADAFRQLLTARTLDALDRIHIPEYFLLNAFGEKPEEQLRSTDERKKAVAVLQGRFGPRYDS